MSNTFNTPDSLELDDDYSELDYDYSWEENGESWIYIAAITRPGLPEPHCYTEVFSAYGKEAEAIIRNFELYSYAQAQEYAQELYRGSIRQSEIALRLKGLASPKEGRE